MAPHPVLQPEPHWQEKLRTGIYGFDLICDGGLPKRRSTLLVGTPGAGKTIWAMQFLAEGIQQFGECGVFVTFEEDPEDIRMNMQGFGWNLSQWEAEGRLRFVDAAPLADDSVEYVGDYDLDALMVRVEQAIVQAGATRVVLDSIGNVLADLPSPAATRQELNRLIRRLKALGATTVITAEQVEPTLHAVSEFVSDNVVLLRNDLEEGKRRRTIEVLKLRGSAHLKGQFSLAIVPQTGISVIPLLTSELNQGSSTTRIRSGSMDLDAMLGGGLFQDSVVLVSGPTGSGKTLTCAHFLSAPVDDGRPHMVLAFEESRDQLVRNARSWGCDFEGREQAGQLIISCEYPESRSIEDHLIQIKAMVARHKPSRIVVDSLTALERICSRKAFREFVINLTSYVKQTRTASVFTATTPWHKSGESMSETHISSMTDTIILLRYIEVLGQIRRGIAVLKMRGSAHDNYVREFTINSAGMRIGQVCTEASQVLSSGDRLDQAEEAERLRLILNDDKAS